MPADPTLPSEEEPKKRKGPRLTLVASCFGCAHHDFESYRVQGDSDYDHYCTQIGTRERTGDSENTPAWCPLSPAESRNLDDFVAAARAVRRVEAECERLINATAPHRGDCCAGCVHTETSRIKAALTGAKP